MTGRKSITHMFSPTFLYSHDGPAPPAIRLHVHPCAACGAATASTWFCADCQDRAHRHCDGDPYDDLGGESGAEA